MLPGLLGRFDVDFPSFLEGTSVVVAVVAAVDKVDEEEDNVVVDEFLDVVFVDDIVVVAAELVPRLAAP